MVATKLDTVHSCWRQGGWSNVGWHTGLFLFCVSICRPHRTESTKNVYCSVSTDTCTGRSCTSEKCARRRGERGEGVCLLVPWSPWSWEMLRDKLARSNPRNRNQKKDSVRSFNGKAHWNFQIGPKGYSCDPGNKPFLSKTQHLLVPKFPGTNIITKRHSPTELPTEPRSPTVTPVSKPKSSVARQKPAQIDEWQWQSFFFSFGRTVRRE